MKFSDHEPEAANFQIAPMIDIVFLLLIFFILTWNVAKQDAETNKEINLPTAQEGVETNSYDHSMVIEIYKDGKIQIGKRGYNVDGIKTLMQETSRIWPDRPITIWADREATVQQAFEIFNICKAEGLANVTIAAKNRQ